MQTHYARQDSFSRGIGPLQRPLPDNTKHSQVAHTHFPVIFEPAVPASEWPRANVLDRAANQIGRYSPPLPTTIMCNQQNLITPFGTIKWKLKSWRKRAVFRAPGNSASSANLLSEGTSGKVIPREC